MIYDYMMFLNENDILDIRLHTHDPIMDKFIIDEAGQTHATGEPKPFNFDHKRFEKFKDKIIYVQIPSLDKAMLENPKITDLSRNNYNASINEGWRREEFQINYFYKIAEEIGIENDDIINWGGLDEIVCEEGFRKALDLIEREAPSETQHHSVYDPSLENEDGTFGRVRPVTPIVVFDWELRSYKLNLLSSRGGHGSQMSKFKEFLLGSLATVRQRDIYTHMIMGPVAHHLTFMSKTPENASYKSKSFAHAHECVEGHDPSAVEAKLFRDYDLRVVGDEGLPKYILENRELFEDYFWKGES